MITYIGGTRVICSMGTDWGEIHDNDNSFMLNDNKDGFICLVCGSEAKRVNIVEAIKKWGDNYTPSTQFMHPEEFPEEFK